jgi:hypothetical protein
MKLKDETKILETMGKLTGPALRWYQENLRSFINWDDAEAVLRNRFKEFISYSQLMQEFFQIKQEENQSVTSFYENVIREYRKARKFITEQHEIISLVQDPEHSLKMKNYLDKLTEEARKNILKCQQQYRTRYDLNRQDLLLKINDLVLVKIRNVRNKLDIGYEGTFKIIKQLGIKTFIVQHVKKLALTRQVTTDAIIPLVERWNLNK